MKKKIINNILLVLIISGISNLVLADNNYFVNGEAFFKKKNYEKARIQFEKDIVFIPKSEKSYLYLAKIFKKEKKIILEENNLKTVMLLNPRNEEAIYQLALLNIQNSNFSKTNELIKTLEKVCKNRFTTTKKLQEKLDALLKK